MNSSMLNMLKLQNPEKDYPSNLGQKWSDSEENILLDELSKNIPIEIIAENHKRTVGGIESRKRHIAYKMYLKNIPIIEIVEKIKLDSDCIKHIIDKKQTFDLKKDVESKVKIDNMSLDISFTEISELRKEVSDLKKDIKEILRFIKVFCDFKSE